MEGMSSAKRPGPDRPSGPFTPLDFQLVLLRRMAERCLRVPMPNAAIDVDTPEDLERLQHPAAAPEDA